MYKPLPKNLRLGFSDIHDIGVFAKEKIEKGHNFGMSHLKVGSELVRTPFGGFINHSDNPNCIKAKLHYTNQDNSKLKFDYIKWNLVALKDINKDEELTVEYTFYKIYEPK